MPAQLEVAILAADAGRAAPPPASHNLPSEGELALAKQLWVESS